MDQESINYLQVIVDEGGISNAAKRLNISQPALSSRIKKIEEYYGITILNANRRPATLTEEGRRYLEFASRQQQLEKSFRRYIQESKELKTGELRIGGTNLYTECLLPDAVKRFNEKYPGISIRIHNDIVPVLTGMTSKGELDLFITSSGKNSQGIVYEPLQDTRLYFCVPGNYPVNKELKKYAVSPDEMDGTADKGKRGFDLKELEDCPFILLDESQLMGRIMRSSFRKYKVSPANFLYTDQALTAYAMTKAGVGVSLMFDKILKQIYNGEDVVFYSPDDNDMLGEIRVAYAEQEYVPEVVREFINILRNEEKDS